MSHTKGPWIVEKSVSNGIPCVATEDNLFEICELWGNGEDGLDIDSETIANANLISAAPDLLEALLDARFALYGNGAGNPKMDAAIAKARGQQ